MTGLYIAVEDELSEAVARRLLGEVSADFDIYGVLAGGGNGYLKSKVADFSNLARNIPVFLLTDLDAARCAPGLINDWLKRRKRPENLLIRVCEREVESWLLGDHEAIRELMGSRAKRLPPNPDSLSDPKRELLKLATSAPRAVREELVAEAGSTAKQGLGYNAVLSDFVARKWCPRRAETRSQSLGRALRALRDLRARCP